MSNIVVVLWTRSNACNLVVRMYLHFFQYLKFVVGDTVNANANVGNNRLVLIMNF